MKRNLILFVFSIFVVFETYSQVDTVDVADLSFKIKSKETYDLYYSFESGDQMIFSCQELNGKEIEGVLIYEEPSIDNIEAAEVLKYSEYKTSKIDEKKINVFDRTVFHFVFQNTKAMAGRTCKVSIKRIPKYKESINFNTGYKYITHYDTTYKSYTQDSLVGYDTTYTPVTKKYFVKNDTSIDVLKDMVTIKVHSTTDKAGNSNVTLVPFTLPEGTTYWAYTIGVGQESKATTNTTVKNVCSAAKTIAASVPNQYSLALYALGYGVELMIPNSGSNVKYYFFSDQSNALLWQNGASAKCIAGAGGDVITDKGKISTPKSGTIYLGLKNDNTFYSIDVAVSIMAVKITAVYETKQEQQMNTNPKYLTLNKKKMVINSHQHMVSAETSEIINSKNNSDLSEQANVNTSNIKSNDINSETKQSEVVLNKSTVSNDVSTSTKTNEISSTSTTAIINSENNFFIIAGSYITEQLANDAVTALVAKGYVNAVVVGKNDFGSYRIAYKGYTSKDEALSDLSGIKQNINPSAWIFEKK